MHVRGSKGVMGAALVGGVVVATLLGSSVATSAAAPGSVEALPVAAADGELSRGQALAELTAAVEATRAREKSVGSRTESNARGVYRQFGPYRGRVTTSDDAATGATRVSDVDFARWMSWKGGSGTVAEYRQNCRPEHVHSGVRSPSVTVRTAEGDLYDDLTVARTPTLRRSQRLIDRPGARWSRLDRADDMYPQDSRPPVAAKLAFLVDDWLGEHAFHERATVTAQSHEGGSRYVLLESRKSRTSRTVIDVSADGTVAGWTSGSRAGKNDRGRRSVEVTYATQRVEVPTARVVNRSRLQPACDAVRTRDVLVRELPRTVRRLNAKVAAAGADLTVKRLRRAAGDVVFQVDIRYRNVPGGILAVGRSKHFDRPLVRRVLVVDGRAVVLRGRG